LQTKKNPGVLASARPYSAPDGSLNFFLIVAHLLSIFWRSSFENARSENSVHWRRTFKGFSGSTFIQRIVTLAAEKSISLVSTGSSGNE
jgi:hypothetical protein